VERLVQAPSLATVVDFEASWSGSCRCVVVSFCAIKWQRRASDEFICVPENVHVLLRHESKFLRVVWPAIIIDACNTKENCRCHVLHGRE
jgi:hypothetical protein